jgi:DNA-binding response OmpR family regulator
MLSNFDVDVVALPDVPLYRPVLREDKPRPVVLVVDDEPIIADTVSLILSRSGFTVLTAYDARSALELAKIIPPELLISDITMAPDMDGVDLAIELVEAIPDCRILLFSAQVGTMDLLAKARQAGHSFTLLAKPLHPTKLLEHARAFVNMRETAPVSARFD